MSTFRRWRLGYLIVVELAQKYTKALFGGFVAGFVLSQIFWRMYPMLIAPSLHSIERIGVVGEFTPSTLPLSIQKEISVGLTTMAPDGTALPGLASSWVATDSGKMFTFYLKDSFMWHTKEPVIAEDVNYNIKNVSIRVIDPKTLQITLPTAYSPLPSLLSKPLFKNGLVGMGEYRVLRIKLNGDIITYLKLTPFRQPSKLKDKEYRFYRTEAASVLAYKMGEVDELHDLSESYGFEKWGKTIVKPETKYTRIVSLYFNMTNPAFQDKNFRHALAYAIRKLSGEKAISPISKTSWGYTDKVKKYLTDDTQARKLLGTDKKESSESASLSLTTFASYADTAQAIADDWSRVGVKTTVKIVNTLPSDYEVLLSGQDVPPDPDQYPFWHSTQTTTNITGFSNVKIDKLLEDGRQVIDTESRVKIYADFQRRIVEEAPVIFLYYPTTYSIYRTSP